MIQYDLGNVDKECLMYWSIIKSIYNFLPLVFILLAIPGGK